MNFTMKVKSLYSENYKTLIKEIEKANKWKVSHVQGLEKLIL